MNVGYYILGHSVHPLKNWLLKSRIDNAQLTTDKIHNKQMCKEKVVVENAFGRLKVTWHFLIKRNDSDAELLKCAQDEKFHNVCESHAENFQNKWDIHFAAAVFAQPAEPLARGEEKEGSDMCLFFATVQKTSTCK